MKCTCLDRGVFCAGKLIINSIVEDRLKGAKLRNGSVLGEMTGSMIRDSSPDGRLFVGKERAFEIGIDACDNVVGVFTERGFCPTEEEREHIKLFLSENKAKVTEVVHESFRRGRSTKRTLMQKVFPAKEPDCAAFRNVAAFNMGLYRRLSEDSPSPFNRPGFEDSLRAVFKNSSRPNGFDGFCINLSQVSFVALLIARDGYPKLAPVQRQSNARSTLYTLVPDLFSSKSSDEVQKRALALLRAAIARDLDESHAQKMDSGWQLPDIQIILDRRADLESDKTLLGNRRA